MRSFRGAAPAVLTALASVIAVTAMPRQTVVAAADPAAPAVAATRAIFSGVGRDGPGCTVAVARNGRVVFAEAYGAADIAAKKPMTTATVVDIGSTSKQFTATAIALLMKDGDVALDDVVSDYLDGLPDWADDVTIDELLHHTSGIPDYIDLLGDAGVDYSDRSTDADALEALADADKLDFVSGKRFEYSNSNYFLLGQIVGEAAGVDITTYLNRTVFGPLRLDAVMSEKLRIAGKAKSYARAGKTWVSADSNWLQVGDGGVQTTPTQLVRWASQYWAPTIGGSTINTVRFRGAVKADEPGTRYGFGMYEQNVAGLGRVLSHDGSWAGFGTAFVVVPQQRLAVAGTCTSEDLAVADTDFGMEIAELWAAR